MRSLDKLKNRKRSLLQLRVGLRGKGQKQLLELKDYTKSYLSRAAALTDIIATLPRKNYILRARRRRLDGRVW